MMVGYISMMLNSVNFCTAQIMGDTDRPKEIDTSSSRRLCRFLLTVVAIIGFIAIVTISLLNQPPKRSHRMWISKDESRNVTRFLDQRALQLNSIDWKCPCKAMDVVSAPRNDGRLVEFFLIDANLSQNVIHVNSVEHFCSEVSSSPYFNGFNATCRKLLSESFRSSGWDFQMGSSNVYMNSLRMGKFNPIAFMYVVCTSWAGGLSQASSFFLISNMGLKEEEARRLNTFVEAIRTSLETCAKHTNWPPPDHACYVEASYKDHDINADRFGYVVAMSFNWTHYYSLCAPSYCEHLEINSVMWVIFTALAQVGGFVSATLFALRSVIWPLFCMLFGWPNCIETAQGKESSPKEQDK